jgi:hypothetical protein
MSENDKPIGTAEAGYIAVGRAASRQPTEAEIQRGIDSAMRGVIADRWTNPNALRAPDKVGVANAVQIADDAPKPANRSGWQEDRPLPIHSAKGSSEEALIDAMAEKFVGGPNSEKK